MLVGTLLWYVVGILYVLSVRLCVIFRVLFLFCFFFQAEDGIRDLVRSRGLGDVYKRQSLSIDNVRQQIVGIDVEVPLLDGSHRPYVNFDNAASTPALRPVHEKVNEFMHWYSSVHRGTGFKSQVATEAYDLAHDIVGCFLGANLETNTVVLGKNATEAINKVARRFPLEHDDVVICSLMEHHSNDLPWRQQARLVHVGVRDDGALDEEEFDRLLVRHAGRVKLVAISGASNVTGHLNPIHRLAEKAHAAGARILVDAAQLAPHRAIDCLLYTSPSPRDRTRSRMPSSA